MAPHDFLVFELVHLVRQSGDTLIYLEGFQFRLLKIKGIDASFPILITVFSNHLK